MDQDSNDYCKDNENFNHSLHENFHDEEDQKGNHDLEGMKDDSINPNSMENNEREIENHPAMNDNENDENSNSDNQQGCPNICQVKQQKKQNHGAYKDLRPSKINTQECILPDSNKPESYLFLGNFLLFHQEGLLITNNKIISNVSIPENKITLDVLKNVENHAMYLDPNDFTFLYNLATSINSKVNLTLHKPSNICYVMKEYEIEHAHGRHQLIKEYKVFSKVKSGYIIKLYGGFFEDRKVRILLEYMNLGSLKTIIQIMKKNKIVMPEEYIALIVRKIIKGLRNQIGRAHV